MLKTAVVTPMPSANAMIASVETNLGRLTDRRAVFMVQPETAESASRDPQSAIHTSRSTTSGSTRAARAAGITLATAATTAMSAAAAANVPPSVGVTPYRTVRI